MNQPPKIEPLPISVPAWMQIRPAPEDLWETDGEPLETNWHRLAMNLLIESLGYFLRDRTDIFVGGNMFIYFSAEQAKNKDYRGPDFFFAQGVDRYKPRDYWYIWEENLRFPSVIVELTSESTAEMDRTFKKDIYERTFKTPDYFLYDPSTRQLEGWRLQDGVYQPIVANDKGRLWSNELQLWLGNWTGSYLQTPGIYPRFFELDGGLVLIGREAAAVEVEAAKQRADAAEAELAALKEKLANLKGNGKPAS